MVYLALASLFFVTRFSFWSQVYNYGYNAAIRFTPFHSKEVERNVSLSLEPKHLRCCLWSESVPTSCRSSVTILSSVVSQRFAPCGRGVCERLVVPWRHRWQQVRRWGCHSWQSVWQGWQCVRGERVPDGPSVWVCKVCVCVLQKR